MTPTRRQLVAGLLATFLPRAAQAADFAIDWQGLPPDPALAARLAHQIAIVRAVPVDAAVMTFFAAEPIHVLTAPGEGSHAGERVFITRDPFPDDNPVLLHELIHRWHSARLAGTPRAIRLRELFANEVAAPHFPRRAYLYTNVAEYLAMTASVVLHGRAARPPFTRDAVRAMLPETYAFIIAEFGVRL